MWNISPNKSSQLVPQATSVYKFTTTKTNNNNNDYYCYYLAEKRKCPLDRIHHSPTGFTSINRKLVHVEFVAVWRLYIGLGMKFRQSCLDRRCQVLSSFFSFNFLRRELIKHAKCDANSASVCHGYAAEPVAEIDSIEHVFYKLNDKVIN